MDVRLHKIYHAWVKIETNQQVLQWIKEGVPLPFQAQFEPFFEPNHWLNGGQNNFICNEIKLLLNTGAIEICTSLPYCVNPLGCVPKKSGT